MSHNELFDNLIPQSDTACNMGDAKIDQESLWAKTPAANLVRYKPSGTYFARAKVGGKLIRQTLKTKVLSVAKLKLADLLKEEHQKQEQTQTVADGKMTFGDGWKIYKQRTEGDPDIKGSTWKYHQEILAALYKSWPGLNLRDIRKISKTDCIDWRSRFSKAYSGTRTNGAISMLRRIIEIGVENGLRYDNPAKTLTRARVRQTHLALPEPEQFEKFVLSIQSAGGGTSRSCAHLVRFLAYGGFRKNEAANVTWSDCDFVKGEIRVRGDAETGTKNWSVRRVPMIPDMKLLLEQLRAERSKESDEETVMKVRECQKAMNRAAQETKMTRITHHDLRHLFATRCIEAGVDVPTVSRWLGHKDGGALAMKIYGHLRDQHSVAMAQKVTFSVKPLPANPANSRTN
jgi:integrase